MKSVPIKDGYLDIVVFSLSLMGKKWHDYISEASRCLMSMGTRLIAETTHSIQMEDLLILKIY